MRKSREGQRGAATRRKDGDRAATLHPEHQTAKRNASKYKAREGDLMTNASRIGCLPEQTIAYWDAALEPTQAASIGTIWVLGGRESGAHSGALIQFSEKG